MLQLQRGKAMRYLVDELEDLGFTWAYRVVNARAFGFRSVDNGSCFSPPALKTLGRRSVWFRRRRRRRTECVRGSVLRILLD